MVKPAGRQRHRDRRDADQRSALLPRLLGEDAPRARLRAQRSIEDAVRGLVTAFRAGKLPNSLEDPRYFNIKRMQEAQPEIGGPVSARPENRLMRVGIDFDNTIASYDARLRRRCSQARGWVAARLRGSQGQLRDTVRLLADGEIKWQMLQGEVYGAAHGRGGAVSRASTDFLRAAARARTGTASSSATRPAFGLRSAPDRPAAGGAALARDERASSIRRLRAVRRNGVLRGHARSARSRASSALGCEVFIDDLEEVFVRPGLSADGRAHPVRDRQRQRLLRNDASSAATWDEIDRRVLDRCCRRR